MANFLKKFKNWLIKILNYLKKIHIILLYIQKRLVSTGRQGLGKDFVQLPWRLKEDCFGFGLEHMRNMIAC